MEIDNFPRLFQIEQTVPCTEVKQGSLPFLNSWGRSVSCIEDRVNRILFSEKVIGQAEVRLNFAGGGALGYWRCEFVEGWKRPHTVLAGGCDRDKSMEVVRLREVASSMCHSIFEGSFGAAVVVCSFDGYDFSGIEEIGYRVGP
ncbi:hypothetical protein [Rhodococcus sp. 1139]|uniref:hypothetical protein n=1 Tax=Rhodococcus sp. 1139 TaxID=1833762 RepID=UPI0021090137|nr:hypothetical protein [Rhodococcus sp. 1139]